MTEDCQSTNRHNEVFAAFGFCATAFSEMVLRYKHLDRI